ncbi:type III secretion system ATPase SctN [Pseudomonas typographi]|uniref:protein-secreting ATPase n=1 Tax=Pseudomonas typographi TaxID=2715964 RepID=A0ABR7Z221_9PSED|nr:type III secretion system ATPase SctN [Pseudomonas typographi]MBD1599535.1 FliI/YscN family ATPase [Pseudomonas typographi]
MSDPLLGRTAAHPLRLDGPLIEAALRHAVGGELCEIRRHWRDEQACARAQVIGFRGDTVLLSLLGQAQGLSRESLIVPTGARLTLHCSRQMLGSVVDARGRIVEQLAPLVAEHGRDCLVDATPLDYRQRKPIAQVLPTGIRVVDALLTCGVGQRIGIFAAAGAGKTSLMNMLIEHAQADVFVIGLVGERGREVTEFIEHLRASPQRGRCVVVYATSDLSSVDRCNAALQATTIAEYFRDEGARVVLMLDSMTRYARARRDLALAAGEAPARRGYPASVFDALPKMLERPGNTATGSITAFYTVLLESDDDPDPIAEEIRSILDGHIYLDRKLAARGHYPAIDVLRSASRVAAQVTAPAAHALASRARDVLGRLQDLQLFIDLGEYRPGENPANDHAMQCRTALEQWQRQALDDGTKFERALEALHEILQ